MPRTVQWRAVGCPVYPEAVCKALEAAHQRGDAELEVTVVGTAYIVTTQPPLQQAQRRDPTKVREVERIVPPAPLAVRVARGLSARIRSTTTCLAEQPALLRQRHGSRLRRHGLLLLFVFPVCWVALLALGISGGATTGQMETFMSSLTFWSTVFQGALASAGSRIAVCRGKARTRRGRLVDEGEREMRLAPLLLRKNVIAAVGDSVCARSSSRRRPKPTPLPPPPPPRAPHLFWRFVHAFFESHHPCKLASRPALCMRVPTGLACCTPPSRRCPVGCARAAARAGRRQRLRCQALTS